MIHLKLPRNEYRVSRSLARASFSTSSVFKRISSMRLPFTLRLVRSHATHGFRYLLLCIHSAGCSSFSAFIGWRWISSVRARDVLCAGIWERKHSTGCDSHRDWLSCVSLSFSLDSRLIPRNLITDPGFSGILEKGYGTQAVMHGDDTHTEQFPLRFTDQRLRTRFNDS